jgi:4-diphosphocytidyl-2-C-methyl-D-erythritol kinase
LRGRRVLVVKPGFGVPTPGAYAALARAGDYLPEPEAEAGLAAWMRDGGMALFNSFERVVFDRYPALPVALDGLSGLGFQPLMTGSGSACFAFLDGRDAAEARALVRAAWGTSALIVETTLA